MAGRTISVTISANTGRYIAGLSKAASATAKFNSQVSNSTGSVGSAAQANQQLSSALNGTARGMTAGFNMSNRYASALKGGTNALTGASQATGFFAKSLSMVKAVGVEAVAALVGFSAIHAVISTTRQLFSFATKSVVDFDKAMTESLAILPTASAATRAAMEAQAIAVSSQTKYSPAEVAEGYYFLASSGMTAAQSMQAVGEVAQFAQAGVLDLEKATELALDVQTAFGLRSNDATQNLIGLTRVMNVMTKAAIDSNATIEQIAEAFTNKFATGLALANRSVEEGAAVLEVYASRGIKGKTAGTQGYMFLRDIQRAAIESAGAMDKYNIQVYDSQGNMNNLVTIAKQLNASFGEMAPEKMRMALKELGLPDRSVAAILPLIATAPEVIDDYYNKVQKSSGAYADVAARQMESIANAMTNLKNKAAGAFAVLGKAGLNTFMTVVKELEDPVTNLISNIQKFGKEVALPALKPVAGLLGGAFVGTIKVLAIAFEQAARALNFFGPAIKPLITLFALLKINQFLIRGFGGGIMAAVKAFQLMTVATQQATASQVLLGTAQMAAGGQQTSMIKAFQMGITGATTAGLAGTDRLKAGFTAVGQSAAGAGVAGSIGMSMLTAGVTLAITAALALYMGIQQLKSSVKQMAQESFGKIGEGYDTKTIGGLQDYNKELKLQEGLISSVQKGLKERGGFLGFLGKGMEFIGLGDDWKEESEKIQRENDAANRNIENNYKELAVSTNQSTDIVRKNAEAMGLDLTLDKDTQKAQQAREEYKARYGDIAEAARSMGVDVTEAMGAGEEAQDEMLDRAKKTAEGVANAFQSMIDPQTIVGQIKEVNDAIAQASGASFSSVFSDENERIKDAATKSAEDQAEAYNKTLDDQIQTLEDKRGKIKNKQSKRGKELDAEIQALKDAKKSKDDFMSGEDPVASLDQFFSSLAGKANQSKQLTDNLLLIKNRLAFTGVQPEFADKIVTELASLGPQGLPIIQQFAQASAQEFTNLAVAAQDSIAKLNPEIAPTWGEVQNRIVSSKKKVEQLGGAMIGLSGYLANQGITADQLGQFVGLGPEFQGMLVTMAGQMGTVPAEEMAQGIRSILDAENFGQGKIPDAIMKAMNWSILIAQGKTGELMGAINDQISMGADSIRTTLEQSGLQDLLNMFNFIAALPGSPAAPGTAGPPPPPPKVVVGQPGGEVKKRQDIQDVLSGKYGRINPEDRYLLNQAAPNPTADPDLWKRVRDILKRQKVPGYADGGIERHSAEISRGGLRIWSEPETGGEAYIPLGMNKRARSEKILGQVAKEFGYGMFKYANGGFYGTAGSRMVGGGAFGTQAQAAQTVVVPMQSKNETNFNGPIVGVNMEDAMRFAERKKRQRALTR